MSTARCALGRGLGRLRARGVAPAPVRQFTSTGVRKAGDGHHHSPHVPPFARTRTPQSKLHEEHELVWDDGVAAEAALDYDAPFISAADGLKMWLGGFAFFASIYGLVWMSDPESRRQAVPRSETLPPTAFNPHDLFTGKRARLIEDAEESDEE